MCDARCVCEHKGAEGIQRRESGVAQRREGNLHKKMWVARLRVIRIRCVTAAKGLCVACLLASRTRRNKTATRLWCPIRYRVAMTIASISCALTQPSLSNLTKLLRMKDACNKT
jgi:hypothetical protein